MVNWPPENGLSFIRSNEFGNIVLAWCNELTERYPKKDFTDAASHVFDWFDRKLKKNRRFINSRRFHTKHAFVAYIRQCVWNAARLAERQRKRRDEILALPVDEPIADSDLSLEQIDELLDAISQLPLPHKDILEKMIFDEYKVEMLAKIYNVSESQVQEWYEEAIDMLSDLI